MTMKEKTTFFIVDFFERGHSNRECPRRWSNRSDSTRTLQEIHFGAMKHVWNVDFPGHKASNLVNMRVVSGFYDMGLCLEDPDASWKLSFFSKGS